MDPATLNLLVSTAFRLGSKIIEARMDKPIAEASNAELLAVLREIDIRTPGELIAEGAGKPKKAGDPPQPNGEEHGED